MFIYSLPYFYYFPQTVQELKECSQYKNMNKMKILEEKAKQFENLNFVNSNLTISRIKQLIGKEQHKHKVLYSKYVEITINLNNNPKDKNNDSKFLVALYDYIKIECKISRKFLGLLQDFFENELNENEFDLVEKNIDFVHINFLKNNLFNCEECCDATKNMILSKKQ